MRLYRLQNCLKKTNNPIARINATNNMENNTERELTFGEKAVGLTFNPSGDESIKNKRNRIYTNKNVFISKIWY